VNAALAVALAIALFIAIILILIMILIFATGHVYMYRLLVRVTHNDVN